MEPLPKSLPNDEPETYERRSEAVPAWSIIGGSYDPESPEQPLDAQRLAQIEDSVRIWHGDAKYRFWAREIVAYTVDLCGIDLRSNPTIGESVEHAINEDFAQAVKEIINPATAPVRSSDVPLEAVEQSPVMRAVKSVIQESPELSADYHAASSVESLSRSMIRLRLSKEMKHSEDA